LANQQVTNDVLDVVDRHLLARVVLVAPLAECHDHRRILDASLHGFRAEIAGRHLPHLLVGHAELAEPLDGHRPLATGRVGEEADDAELLRPDGDGEAVGLRALLDPGVHEVVAIEDCGAIGTVVACREQGADAQVGIEEAVGLVLVVAHRSRISFRWRALRLATCKSLVTWRCGYVLAAIREGRPL
jgi:hypothetical protein